STSTAPTRWSVRGRCPRSSGSWRPSPLSARGAPRPVGGGAAPRQRGPREGAAKGVAGGVDAIEHGFELDEDVATEMARRGTFLVSTLAVFRSWETFGATTSIDRFTGGEGRARIAARRERGEDSVRIAHRAGVRIA